MGEHTSEEDKVDIGGRADMEWKYRVECAKIKECNAYVSKREIK